MDWLDSFCTDNFKPPWDKVFFSVVILQVLIFILLLSVGLTFYTNGYVLLVIPLGTIATFIYILRKNKK